MGVRSKAIRALLIAGVAGCAIASPLADNIWITPAAAQAVSLTAEFRTALEPYGTWQRHRRWGEVWIPSSVAQDWQPYTVGHWVYTQDYGWYWEPAEQEAEWGLVTYHYGRWAFDDDFGWMWIPGTEWGPGWVQWRHGGQADRQYVGWEPLPPDDVITEYRERPQFWVFVRERDVVAPRIREVILPPREREVFFRDTFVVNRTVEFRDRRFAVNPGIPPTYIAAAYGRPIPSHEISPRVFAGSANLPGAVVVRADDFRNRERIREITRETTIVRQTNNTIAPARERPALQPLGANEHGRLGALPPRAAESGFANRPEGREQEREGRFGGREAAPGQPLQQGREGREQEREGRFGGREAAPGQPLQQPGREGREQGREGRFGGREGVPDTGRPGQGPAQGELRGNRGERDQRNQREGRPAAPNAPSTGPTTGAAPGAQRNEGRGDERATQPGRDQRSNQELRDQREGRPAAPNAPTTGAAPGAQRNEGRGDERTTQPGRDQRGMRENRPGAPPNVPRTEEGRRGPQAPSTSGAAPNSRERGGERELGNRPPQGAAPPQELRGRERSGVESQSPRNQGLEGPRGAMQRPSRPESPAAQGRGSPGMEAPRAHAPGATPEQRPQSPATTGAAPGGGRAMPGGGGGGGRRDEHERR